jgi:hypothetical protein
MIILSRFGDHRQPSTVWCTAAEKSSIASLLRLRSLADHDE